ncbi:hypothetical protein [Miltoncostaea oceani]|uniref:hypothetical protein n=1 Tax=Miltoncostaea oceani TaxID=2843216 RepID=UPI001C3C82CC|nr:hypothetical protein [Miltoncostaea oceani]
MSSGGIPDFEAGPARSRAVVRWGRHEPDWRGYAIGYRRAADALAQEATTGRVSLDLFVFPLAGLYRHALELHLKWLTVAIREELGTSTALLMTHDIERLWRHLREPLRPLGLRDPDWESLDAKVLAWSRLDPKGVGFRYPVTVSGEPALTMDALNLEVLAQTSTEILDALEALIGAARDEGRVLAGEAMVEAASEWWYSLASEERERYEEEHAELHEAYMAGHIP